MKLNIEFEWKKIVDGRELLCGLCFAIANVFDDGKQIQWNVFNIFEGSPLFHHTGTAKTIDIAKRRVEEYIKKVLT